MIYAVPVLLLAFVPAATGHGRLIDPPSRSSMWRYGFKNPRNYDDNALYCGGTHVSRFSFHTLVNVYVDLVVFTRIAGTLKTGSGIYWR